ncbi:MAG TPA: crossover junction endodeoxyribonuclease RuvC, partial [Candidatus Synoicihabitans sp.]|nr:crossover junction endodeoxyribonuclease RuvC [Candidatus Synoicihabitans sp.]
RLSVRELWKAKLEGRPVPSLSPTPLGRGGRGGSLVAPQMPSMQRAPFIGQILGVDPSLRGTGLALVEFVAGRSPVLLRCVTVRVPPSQPMPVALAEIHKAVTSFLTTFEVRHVALEQTIYVQNFQTAQILGAARGAAIAAAALRERPIFEYPPLRVKQAVVGAGRASKEQMARTVMALLGHGRVLAADEADAVGVALCHAFTWRG